MRSLFIDTGITDEKLIHVKMVDTPYLDRPYHFHPNCELVYIENGYGTRVIGDNVSNFHEGDLVMMGPNLPHVWTNDNAFYKGIKYLHSKAIVIYFSPALLDHLLDPDNLKRVLTLIKKSHRGLTIYGKTKVAIIEKLSTIDQKDGLLQLVDFFFIFDMLLKTKEIKYLASDKFVNTLDEHDTSRINSVYLFLMKNFKRDIQLEEVASIAHMAPTAFCRFFKQRTQKTLSHFINELRIHHACELLNNPHRAITEIFYECGYHNPTNFNKFFKEITGETPSSYRKNVINDTTL